MHGNFWKHHEHNKLFDWKRLSLYLKVEPTYTDTFPSIIINTYPSYLLSKVFFIAAQINFLFIIIEVLAFTLTEGFEELHKGWKKIQLLHRGMDVTQNFPMKKRLSLLKLNRLLLHISQDREMYQRANLQRYIYKQKVRYWKTRHRMNWGTLRELFIYSSVS